MLNFNIKKQLKSQKATFHLGVTAELSPGSFTGIYGPSGAGKTTLLRLLSGLDRVDQGQIIFNNQVWVDSEKNIFLTPQKRSIGYLFQEYHLFPNMTVRENLAFAADEKTPSNLLEELLDITELKQQQKQYPASLSGGEQQRTALARALMRQPSLLLLDEPLAALDPTIRTSLQQYIHQIHQRYQLSTIMVSHQASELAMLCDQVLEMKGGKIVRKGTPDILFSDKDTIDPGSSPVRVLAVSQTKNSIIAELLVGTHKMRLALNGENHGRLKAGDFIVLKAGDFTIMDISNHKKTE